MNKKYLTDITFLRCLRRTQGFSGFMIHKQKIEIFLIKNRIHIVQLTVGSKKNALAHQPLTREASRELHITDSADPKVSPNSLL